MDRMPLPPGLILLSALALSLLLMHSQAGAWGPGAHEYMCPAGLGIDCGIADQPGFKGEYPYGGYSHNCYDNNSRCTARLLARYYLKKYYLGGREDRNLLGAAAHLIQDSECPAHWLPIREFLGTRFTVLGPPWATGLEGITDINLREHESWGMQIEYQGIEIGIDRAYLDRTGESVAGFLSQEPGESLEEIEAALKERDFWMYVRGFREVSLILALFLVLALAFDAWRWKKGRKKREMGHVLESVMLLAVLAALLILTALGHFFY